MRQATEIYGALKDCKDFAFRDQIQRSAVSVPSNIAEGFERQTDKEFVQFLYIAKGSCGELRTQIYLALKLSYIEKTAGKKLIEQTKQVSSKISKLISYRKNGTKR